MNAISNLLGQRLGPFRIVEELGSGGMGTVYRGTRSGSSDVAIKVLHPRFTNSEELRARFEREARLAAEVTHPNAVRIQGLHEDAGRLFIVMELVRGQLLFDVVADQGRLPAARAVAIALQVCEVVGAYNDRGIVHRDLKPENIMLEDCDDGDRVKLLDFGAAVRCGTTEIPRGRCLSSVGAVVGTPRYMSPEQCKGERVDARSDVYACGVLLYHLVTGRPPFDNEMAVQTLYRHVHEQPAPPSQHLATLDSGLEAIILKALRKAPSARHQSVFELWDELLSALPRLRKQESGVRTVANAAPAAAKAEDPQFLSPALEPALEPAVEPASAPRPGIPNGWGSLQLATVQRASNATA